MYVRRHVAWWCGAVRRLIAFTKDMLSVSLQCAATNPPVYSEELTDIAKADSVTMVFTGLVSIRAHAGLSLVTVAFHQLSDEAER